MNAPSGALDSPLRDRWEVVLSLTLDMADDFIDGDKVRREKALDFSGCYRSMP
jgi:hypothetical protein